MDKTLKSAFAYTFGSGANSKSNGKSKNSKSNKGDSKASREFIDKEIFSTQTANEIDEINQLTGLCDSDGQSYGTSEEENVLSGDEICQQQCGQQEESPVQQSTEVDVVMSNNGEACYAQVVQSTNPIEVSQQSTVIASEENEAGFICTESKMDEQSVQKVVEESKIVQKSKSVEDTKVTQKTSIASQETQEVSKIIYPTPKVCSGYIDPHIVQEVETVAKTVDVSKQSQQKSQSISADVAKTVDVSEQSQQKSQSISADVAPCFAGKVISTPIDVIKQSTTATKSQKGFCSVDTTNAAVKQVDVSEQSQQKSQSISADIAPCFAAKVICTPIDVIKQSPTVTTSQKTGFCSVDTVDAAAEQVDSCKCCEIEIVSGNETKKELSQSLITKITEIHQDSCKKAAVVEKCHESIETETKLTLNFEMSLEAKSKFSATIEEDSEVLITAKFVNPLCTPLTDGKFWIEADNLGKPYCFEIPHINAGETVICRALIFPRCAGYEFIVARFVSREIKRIIGFTNIRVSHAAPCESIGKVIIVPKIANEKVVACKKM